MANWRVTVKFTIPAFVSSVLGAMLLIRLGQIPAIYEYELFGKPFRIEIRLTMGIIIAFFSLFDLLPRLSKLNRPSRYIPLGGAVSGFFGGLSGMQGALRSMFLIRAGLSKEQFIGTGVVSAVIVDISRLAVYGTALVSGRVTKLREAGISIL